MVLLTDLLVPGRFPGNGEFSLAVDLGRVAVLDSGRAEFLLAGDPSWVAESAVRDAEFSLANSPGCFSLRRRGRNLRGSLREASCGGVFSWFSEGAGEVRSPWYQVGGGAGSGTQFRYLSQGDRVTSPPRKTLACEIVLEGVSGAVKEAIQLQQPPNRGPHRVSQTFLTWASDVALEGVPRGGVLCSGQSAYQLLEST